MHVAGPMNADRTQIHTRARDEPTFTVNKEGGGGLGGLSSLRDP